MNDTTNSLPPQQEALRTTCPYCLSKVDLHLDIKGRPYWWCWRCEVQLFGTKTALTALKADGWIWSEELSLEAVRAWLKRAIPIRGPPVHRASYFWLRPL